MLKKTEHCVQENVPEDGKKWPPDVTSKFCRHTETLTHRDTDTQRHRQTETKRHRQKKKHRDRKRDILKGRERSETNKQIDR